ncbi:MAG: hypothetical protein WC250_01590 [Candidatus Paceibacterota bacterium]|jgi:hypothetical protein
MYHWLIVLIQIVGVLSCFLGFVLMMVGFNYALWGSALRNRDAIPDGLTITVIGAVLFFAPLVVEKFCF